MRTELRRRHQCGSRGRVLPSSPAAAWRGAEGAGLDGSTSGRGTLNEAVGTPSSDTVRQVEYRFLQIDYFRSKAAVVRRETIDCASVSPSVRCVPPVVRRRPASVSDNVRWKWRSIARRAVHHCALLHLEGGEGLYQAREHPAEA